MAKISSSKKVVIEELPSEHRGWFQKVTGVINPFMEQVYQILTQGITISDNLKAQKITTTVSVNQVYPIAIKYNLNDKPYAVHIASIQEDNSSNQAVQKHSLTWYYNDGTLNLYFDGLDAAKRYTVNLYTLV